MPPEVYRDYLEARFHPDLAAHAEDSADWVTVIGAQSTLSAETLAAVDERGAMSSGGGAGAYDLALRLAELDAEGVAAELVFPGTQYGVSPFCSANQRPWPREHRIAGVKAYHRWLGDFVAGSAGRLGAVAQALPSTRVEDMVAELRHVASLGFVSTAIPGDMADADLPPLYDSYYEPFWAACAELGLVLSIHAGHGAVQGGNLEGLRLQAAKIRSGTAQVTGGSDMAMSAKAEKSEPRRDTRSPFVLDVIHTARQAWCQLMLSGVFDRHPTLKLVLTEVRSDWVPASLAHLDARFAAGDLPLKKKPSEYWNANCFLGAAAIHPAEVEIRHQIGIRTLMFGRDYPHNDGTWPYTWDWIRAAFGGVPEDEARLMLGENAIRCYGLDRATLKSVAQRIGPQPADVLGDHSVNPRKIDHWQSYAGFNNPVPPHDGEDLDRLLNQDLAAVGASSGA
jgi:predicted TIM-barrel fold metal-dependent hydrolase